MRTWSVVAEMVGSHGRCALVTVVDVRGSAPREPGARMVVAPDGSFRGTIGGGELEWQAIGAARDALSSRASVVTSGSTSVATLDRLTLGPDLGQCCGGSVRLLTEVFDRARLDEVRDLAAREAAGPFTTRGRIRPHGVERQVIDGPTRGAHLTADASRLPSYPTPSHPVFGHPTPGHPTPGHPAPGHPAPSRPVPSHPALGHPVVVDASADADSVPGRPRKERRRGGNAGGANAGPSVVLENDDLIVEHFHDPRRPVWLFGAGHVGRALMLALAPLPFEVTWIDERADAFPAAAPANVRAVRSADPVGEVVRVPDGALIVVMTHSHARDLAIVHAALAAGRFGYVGLIGSAGKRARFMRRLREAGVPEVRIAELVCPIGVPTIGSKHPAAIAAGVAVQLLERDEALNTSVAPMRGVAAGVTR